MHVATDGETYGHHHKYGDMALAYCLDFIEKKESVTLTNYGQFLYLFPPTEEVQIIENSSWSCVHGVERWRNDCGCHTGGHTDWNQKWRKPLREALDWLRDATLEVFEKEAVQILNDPWRARLDYVSVVLKRNDHTVKNFLRTHALENVQPTKVLYLMEMERNAMLMYTSCGWFFDEVSGIETTQILQYACRVIQLANQLHKSNWEEEFLKRLEAVPSNLSQFGNAAKVYEKSVMPSLVNLKRVGMHFAMSSIFEEEPETLTIFNYAVASESIIKKAAGEQKLAVGMITVRSQVTLSERKFAFAVIYLGKHNLIGNISINMESDDFAGMQFRMVKAFEESRLGDVIGTMQMYFGPEKYTIWQLFSDEKRKILEFISQERMAELESSLRKSYNSDYPLITALANNGLPIPNTYRTTFEYVLNADLIKNFTSEKINIKELERISSELEHWNLKIEDPDKLSRLAGESIWRELKRINSEHDNIKRLSRLNRLFPLLEKFNLDPNLHKSQNLYFEMSKERHHQPTQEWHDQFALLGMNLGVKVS